MNEWIVEDKNSGEGKGYSFLDQIFKAESNELLFISIALKLNWNFVDSLLHDDLIARIECNSSPILRKI